MKILKFNESLNISYEKMVNELCRYRDYLSTNIYKKLFELSDLHVNQRYEESLVPVNDIRNYCWYENTPGGINWKFSKKQMMNLKLPTTKSYVQEMYHVIQREIVSWNDVDDIESSLLSSLEDTGLKYSLQFITDMFFCSWWIEVYMDEIKEVDKHFKVLQTFKLLDKRSKGIKEVQIQQNSNRKSKYILQIKHIKIDNQGKPIVDKRNWMRKENIKK
jgi:hypothetical protein